MSWRENLEVNSNAQYPQNTQKSATKGNFVHIANSAERKSKLLEILSSLCHGLSITPQEVFNGLKEDNFKDWCEGHVSNDALKAFAELLVENRDIKASKKPANFSKQANCKLCGPIWWDTTQTVNYCPWCQNRKANKPIPRPIGIYCGDCIHFIRINHPHLGHCAQKQPEALAGLWDTDCRYCEMYLPKNNVE
ncbi:hypothetical protein [Legionella sainthelensi]|uniref:hypothetical protein n=1 Tax=Legionella sainthelensi TaxID=28087 RepID=UPI000E20AAFC|nr:hypothetical protein [Legionella sainthelensi]